MEEQAEGSILCSDAASWFNDLGYASGNEKEQEREKGKRRKKKDYYK